MPNVMWSSPPSKLCKEPRAMTSATSGIESRLGSRVGTGDGEAAAGDLATGPVEPCTLPAQPAVIRSNALMAATLMIQKCNGLKGRLSLTLLTPNGTDPPHPQRSPV